MDTVLGPEMKSTGEVMGVADNFGEAFAKAQLAAGQKLPVEGTVFISVTDHDKPHVASVARKFVDMGFKLVATAGTADVLEADGMSVERVYKVKEGRPNVVDLIKGERIHLIVNTPHGQDPFFDEKAIRRAAVQAAFPRSRRFLRREPQPREFSPCRAGKCECRRCNNYMSGEWLVSIKRPRA